MSDPTRGPWSRGQPEAPDQDAADELPSRWVLVAEDDQEMRRLLVRAVSVQGYELVQAGSGLELFDVLRRARGRRRPPDLLVSDIRMPGLSGVDVLRAVRSWGWRMPFILITAFPDEETRDEALRLGADAVLDKPFDMDGLRAVSLYLLRRAERAALREHGRALDGEDARGEPRDPSA